MRSEYDMVEDVRIVKASRLFSKRSLIILVAVMLFLIGCGIFFRTTYLYAVQQIEVKEKYGDGTVEGSKNYSSKTYYIEQRLREDLEKILQQKK